MDYPRILMIGIERINANDTNNNGLLLRNLFCDWPRQKLAQIFSYNDNGDKGFFQYYYRISANERKIGSIFFKLKKHEIPKLSIDINSTVDKKNLNSIDKGFKIKLKNLFIDTGLFELIFRPKISSELSDWIERFQPSIIFVQGYNLFYIWLALKLKKKFGVKLAFLTTDDWPTYLYSGINGEPKIFRWFIRPIVNYSMQKLISEVDIPFAFHQPMADEYEKRYAKKFIILSHSDEEKRFEEAVPVRFHPDNITTIVVAGFFNRNRWPLLLDLNECCRLLVLNGISARILVLSAGMEYEGMKVITDAEFIDIISDPGNDILPQYLKGADINLLIEDFDEKRASAISLSVSSKSHLFMFSQRPTIIYAHPNTGVSRYAKKNGWARVISTRDVSLLKSEILNILSDVEGTKRLVSCAKDTYTKYHLRHVNHQIFLKALTI
jgi:hypothetical protein